MRRDSGKGLIDSLLGKVSTAAADRTSTAMVAAVMCAACRYAIKGAGYLFMNCCSSSLSMGLLFVNFCLI